MSYRLSESVRTKSRKALTRSTSSREFGVKESMYAGIGFSIQGTNTEVLLT